MKLSIIILSYNTREFLRQALLSIKNSQDHYQKEIIIVDNASTDGSQAVIRHQFNWVKLIQASQNLGYAAANNLGLTRAKGEYILFLNSDTQILPDTLTIMVKFMDQHQDVGVSTCRVELPGGQIDPASHRGFPTPWNAFTYFSSLEKLFPHHPLFAKYHQGWKNLLATHEIDSPAGAFYLTRKHILDKIGGFDERFFMYAEDLDLSLRIKNAGYKIIYVPDTKIIHHKKKSGLGSSDSQIRSQTRSQFFSTMKLFYDKHYKSKYPKFIRWLVISGIWVISKLKH